MSLRTMALGLLLLAPAAAAQGERLRIASYNVENLFDNHDDPYKPDEGTPPKTWEDRRILAGTIEKLDADVLALQEVENLGVLMKLNLELSKPFPFIEILPGNDFRGIHCALMSRLRIRRSLSHRFQELDGRRYARNLAIYELDTGRQGSLLVAPVHFKSKRSSRGDPGSLSWRLAEARGALRVLEEIRSLGFESPFVLVGDLNDLPGSEPLRLLETVLENGLTSIPEEERFSYLFDGRKQQIDHLLFQGRLEVRKAGFLHEKGPASDHAPLFVDFAWPSPLPRVEGPAPRPFFKAPHRPLVSALDTRRLRTLLLQEVEVHGRITGLRRAGSGGNRLLHFSEKKGEGVVGFVPGKLAPRFGNLERYLGKEVVLVGPLFRYGGQLEIRLSRPGQLRMKGGASSGKPGKSGK